ncbi:MAG: hypothetical protein BYD32DRAFT_465124 [Podila humilis]|nr:MAG: hypothetical protein BYD32DRAFT_465124 [Podila humilis]
MTYDLLAGIHITGTLIYILTMAWAIHSLAMYFTFTLTICQGLQLIGYGPYSYLRHPLHRPVHQQGHCHHPVVPSRPLGYNGCLDDLVDWTPRAGIPVISDVAS